MAERMIEVSGVALCAESFGDPSDPPILLVMGLGASMLWWDDGFCRQLADGGRFVIRYDHRDTGRSVTYEPGQPGYDGDDLAEDIVGVLDAHGLLSAHLVGVSAGGALVQLVALRTPARVRSLVLISTSPVTPGDRGLPPPTEELGRFFATATVDWSDREAVVEHLVGYARVLAGRDRPFDQTAAEALVRHDLERACDPAALQNHDLIASAGDDRPSGSLSSIAVPVLVIHGTADPLFPPDHGEVLAEEIPGATLLTLEGAGHGVDQADWDVVVPAILEHTEG